MKGTVIALVLTIVLAVSPSRAAVGYDNTASTQGTTVSSLTTGSFTITSAANRAAMIGLGQRSTSATSFTASVGGVSATAIANTDSGATVVRRSLMFQVIAPPSGSQTATASWVTATSTGLGVVTASGVDQTTPTNNGTFATGTSTTPSVTITSTSGGLTVDSMMSKGVTLSGATQTQRWNQVVNGEVNGGSTGPGTGTTTHQWTTDSATFASSGANFNAAPANPGTRSLLGVGAQLLFPSLFPSVRP